MFGSSTNVHVTFIAADKDIYDVWPKPVLAAENKPEWHTKTPAFYGTEKPNILVRGGKMDLNPTVKLCMPVLDMMSAGYHILLPCDVYVSVDPATGSKHMLWPQHLPPIIKNHAVDQLGNYPIPEEYDKVAFKWHNPWILRTPPGWSCIFQHPTWHDEVPFRTFPALVDTDHHEVAVEFPFLLKRSFTGCIPKDTPIAQVIPFRRLDTKATYTWDQDGSYKAKSSKLGLYLLRAYQKFVRQKKSYTIEESQPGKCPFSDPK
jgi:hypothetical protein